MIFITIIFFTFILNNTLGQNYHNTRPQDTCQGTLDSLIAQINSSQYESESNACACACSSAGTSWKGPPPQINIDMSSLLQNAVQREVQTQNEQIIFRLGQEKQSEQAKYYNRSSLNMIKLGLKQYFVSRRQQMSWIDAASFCRLYDMELVTIESRQEDELILQHLRSIGLGNESSGVFTSANQIGGGVFTWSNGQPLLYSNWGKGEPSLPSNEHCLIYWKYAWADFPCTSLAYFMCEAY